MSDFYYEEIIKKSRKEHRCDGCGHTIPISSSYLKYAGVHEGDFGSFIYHTDCRAAEVALNKKWDAYEWIPLSERDCEDREWMTKDFPEVAARIFAKLEAA